jgi:hypothetical protein
MCWEQVRGFDQRPFHVGSLVEKEVRSLPTTQSLSLHYHCTNASYTLVFPFSATDALQLTQPVTTSLLTAPHLLPKELIFIWRQFCHLVTDIWTTSEVHKWERNQHINALYTSHDQNLRLKTSKFDVKVRQRKGIEVYEHSTNAPYLWAHATQYVLLLVYTYTIIFYLIFQSGPQSVHLPQSGWLV